jgi:NAD(P)-dependent dehydrogenase (short-subunit alcohol dehydrogenase family)
LQADLSLVREACRLGEEVTNRWRALHYLVHSAGVVRGRRVLTAEGFESNFATNYLSRFALTTCLLSSLATAGQPAKSARIVLVAHPGLDGTIDYDDVNLTAKFSTIRAFKQFHYANDVFTVEFARRQPSAGQGPRITISCLHPGPTKTSIDHEMPLWMKLLVRGVVHPLFSHAPDVPAAAALRLLLADEFEGESGGLFTVIGGFKRVARSRRLAEPQEGQRLWTCSETLIRSALDSTTRTLLAVT